MPRPKSGTALRSRKASGQRVSLKSLAEHLGLSQAAVSLVINRSPGAKSIPLRTQELIRQAARELNYRPNHLARSLRQQRSYTIGVMVPEISEGYAALVMSGIEDHLLQEGYFYFVVSHRHRDELIEEYPLLLQQQILLDQFIAVAVAHHKIKEAFLQQMIFNPGHHQRGIPFADLRHHHADRVAPLLPERSRQMIRSVVQLAGRLPDQFLRTKRNRFCAGRAVDDQRHGRLGESQVLCERLETYTLTGCFSTAQSCA